MRPGIFGAAHCNRGAFEILDKFNELMPFDAPGVRIIVTKTIRGNTEAESTVAELPALQVGIDNLPDTHCS